MVWFGGYGIDRPQMKDFIIMNGVASYSSFHDLYHSKNIPVCHIGPPNLKISNHGHFSLFLNQSFCSNYFKLDVFDELCRKSLFIVMFFQLAVPWGHGFEL